MKAKPQILVVDDDKEMTAILKDFLTKQGYSVKTASSGSQAYRLFNSPGTRPDMVLSDVKMGPMSGIDLTKKLMEKDPTLPVVLFSVCDTGELEIESLQSGAAKFLHKPFSLSQIAELVSTELTRRSSKK